jgi:proteasome accessory factor A
LSQRITGLETEYGCLVQPPAQAVEVLPAIRDWLFENQRYGLIDLHARGWDEPAGNGGFLFNGGRVYLDMGHLEYCTPECASALDVVRYDRAGDLLLLEAVRALGLAGRVNFFRNNIDHYTGATFGCHENYSIGRAVPLTRKNRLSLLAFLTLRVLFTGAGRVGSSYPNFLGGDEPPGGVQQVPFQISQRADFIVNDCFEWVQHNRAIINLRDEPLADSQRFRRLHLILGDTNVLPSAMFLKVGATRLVLDLLEADQLPALSLADPVGALRILSRKPEPPWRVALADGKSADALVLAGLYCQRAKQLFGGRDPETDALLALWASVLEALATDPESLVGTLDWVSKKYLLGEFLARQGLDWDHPWLKSQDLEFHHIDPDRSFGLALARPDGFWRPTGLDRAKLEPPPNSRACARSRLMRNIQRHASSYFVDWEEVSIPNQKRALLLDPFRPGPDGPPRRAEC